LPASRRRLLYRRNNNKSTSIKFLRPAAFSGRKTSTVPFPPGEGERTLNVLIEAAASDTQAGLGGTVTIE
jgi:hypothetical protein